MVGVVAAVFVVSFNWYLPGVFFSPCSMPGQAQLSIQPPVLGDDDDDGGGGDGMWYVR